MSDEEYCSLCFNHLQNSFSIGPKGAKVAVVTNRKSSGRFQDALELQLRELGLDMSDVYYTPVIKCSDFDTSLSNRQLKTHAADYLIPELDELKNLKYILCLGNEALLAVTGKSGITKYRGKEFDYKGALVMSTISPSAVNRNPGQKPGYLADLRLFLNQVKGIKQGLADPKNVIIGDSKENLKKICRVLEMTEEISIDVETKNGEYYQRETKGSALVSIAATCVVRKPDGTRGLVVWAVPLSHRQSVWRSSWRRVMAILGKHVSNIREVDAHNGSYDCKWMFTYDMPLMVTFDTMLAIALLDENVQKGLKPQAMARLAVPSWGIDTGDLDSYSIDEVLWYNILDTWYTYHIKKQLVKELAAQPRLENIFYNLTMKAQADLIPSEMRGIWIDVPLLKERKPIAEKRLAEIEERIRAAAKLPEYGSDEWPHKILIRQLKSGTKTKRVDLEENFNASQFARWMLFDWCGLPIIERGKPKDDGSPGDPSMAEDVLKHLRDETKHPVLEPMLERVTAQKHLSSFFNPYEELYDEDHRIHTTFKLAGTVTGRLSSGKSDADKISGSRGKLRGVNLQQVPRDPFIRGLFGAPSGWTFVEADYSQIELRVAAFLADETNMKHIYATGGDIHATTASRVSGIPISQLTKEDRKKGKPVNFGFLYGMGWRKFIETAFSNYNILFSEAEAQAARIVYFDMFPKLIPWHNRQRRLVKEYGRVQSPIGRVRHLPDIYSPDQGVRAEAERQAINSPVQGFASDMAVSSMIDINYQFRKHNIQGYCLGLVHDAINFEIRNDELPRALPIIKTCMEDMNQIYKKFGAVIDIPIIADIALGKHWGEKVELNEDQVFDFQPRYLEELGLLV